jgi:hypothetical protein
MSESFIDLDLSGQIITSDNEEEEHDSSTNIY